MFYLSFFFFYSILRWSVAVSTMRRQSSRIAAFLQADARPMFCWPRSASIARSQVWLGLPDGRFQVAPLSSNRGSTVKIIFLEYLCLQKPFSTYIKRMFCAKLFLVMHAYACVHWCAICPKLQNNVRIWSMDHRSIISLQCFSLQCFDTVGWVTGWASGL